ncbi:MAG: adenylosuccinate synthetase [Bacteroidota bacterium]
MKTKIILGLGYGDEGKGLTTDYLCRQAKHSLVIRFSGGHQAGHTVVTPEGQRHVFSSFGSGTLWGVPTYWSRYCTLYPTAFVNEWDALRQMNIEPDIFVDARAMITTPYDVYYNRMTETDNQHGSCGVGVGATVERNEGPFKLYALDLCYPTVWQRKLNAIRNYYEQRKAAKFDQPGFRQILKDFAKAIEKLKNQIKIVHEAAFLASAKSTYDQLLFEGSQGILLDQDFGFFPNVTRAYVTSRNAMELIHNNMLPNPEIYYITRTYQTRHGNGFLSNETIPLDIQLNPLETNQYNPWQGEQRRSPLDIDLLRYALDCDHNYSAGCRKHLVITCLDQIKDMIPATLQHDLLQLRHTSELTEHLPYQFESVLESWSEVGAGMRTMTTQTVS